MRKKGKYLTGKKYCCECIFCILIIRYFASRQKRQEYNWQLIDIWAFRSSVPISKENKATGTIADIHILF
jgi:hypothetical protein